MIAQVGEMTVSHYSMNEHRYFIISSRHRYRHFQRLREPRQAFRVCWRNVKCAARPHSLYIEGKPVDTCVRAVLRLDPS